MLYSSNDDDDDDGWYASNFILLSIFFVEFNKKKNLGINSYTDKYLRLHIYCIREICLDIDRKITNVFVIVVDCE